MLLYGLLHLAGVKEATTLAVTVAHGSCQESNNDQAGGPDVEADLQATGQLAVSLEDIKAALGMLSGRS